MNYIQRQRDHTLFVKYFGNKKITTLMVYVDNIIEKGDDLEEMERSKKKLEKEFATKH